LKCDPTIKTLQCAPAIKDVPGLLQSITVPLLELLPGQRTNLFSLPARAGHEHFAGRQLLKLR
jgi:hypothetical protein